jgi:hypothetical protein
VGDGIGIQDRIALISLSRRLPLARETRKIQPARASYAANSANVFRLNRVPLTVPLHEPRLHPDTADYFWSVPFLAALRLIGKAETLLYQSVHPLRTSGRNCEAAYEAPRCYC